MNIYIIRICKLQIQYFRITEKGSSNKTISNYQTNL